MPLANGARLGPYEIQAAIGAGGMGEVYKARDTRLDRTVAIKVLPPDVSADPERRARFEREAKTVAGLSHPHICPLFDVGDHEGAIFLVMEHLAGQTLAERLEKGPLPLEQALTVATEIADALSAAHRQGVIHRDLKPGNVMLTKGGAKLLDFGLAKLTGHGEGPAAVQMVSAAPTQAPLTGYGVIVGTLQYMAPEQLEGKPPDARADLWALGAILYEMVTGKRAFEGRSTATLMAAILERNPDPIASHQSIAPPALDRLVGRCLAKDPEERWQSAADVAAELRWLATDRARERAVDTRTRSRPRGRAVATALLGLVMVGIGSFLAGRFLTPSVTPAPTRLHVSLGEFGLTLLDGGVAVSPDGRTVVFQARAADTVRLYARHLGDWQPRALAGTEGGSEPFFSPGGEWVAYRSASGGFEKIPVNGGTTQWIWRTPTSTSWTTGAVWTLDDEIIFGRWPETGLWSVAASGGTARQLHHTTGEGDWCLWPDALPGGKAILFTRWRAGRMSVHALLRSTGEVRAIVESAAGAKYVPGGHLVYESDGKLFAGTFDATTLGKGESRAVVPDIGRTRFGGSWRQSSRGRPYDISANGTLAYGVGLGALARLVWRDRSGTTTPTPLGSQAYNFPTLSPDGMYAVDTIYDGAARALWFGRLDTNAMHALTHGPDDCFALFTPDGGRVLFTRNDGGRYNLFTVAVDGSEEPQLVVDSAESKKGTSYSNDGRLLLYNRRDPSGGMDVWQMKDGISEPVIATPSSDRDAQLSPDGRWVLYTSSESGRPEVYIRRYRAGSPEQLSTNGGSGAVWRRDGTEVFYQGPSGVMAARILNGRRAGPPVELFPHVSEYPKLGPGARREAVPGGGAGRGHRPDPGQGRHKLVRGAEGEGARGRAEVDLGGIASPALWPACASPAVTSGGDPTTGVRVVVSRQVCVG